ncbi:hypothetical protein NDU88_005868 [Pleurodeles waltl]|uniref:Uncharacterized protein n=1 Tax=Pleurodeles waltl TaxID=8319 RepID=A0AAV7L8U3_PLEWA|nr:hypothetical protein NDU88_005868 [Pleurodeles waltl]
MSPAPSQGGGKFPSVWRSFYLEEVEGRARVHARPCCLETARWLTGCTNTQPSPNSLCLAPLHVSWDGDSSDVSSASKALAPGAARQEQGHAADTSHTPVSQLSLTSHRQRREGAAPENKARRSRVRRLDT